MQRLHEELDECFVELGQDWFHGEADFAALQKLIPDFRSATLVHGHLHLHKGEKVNDVIDSFFLSPEALKTDTAKRTRQASICMTSYDGANLHHRSVDSAQSMQSMSGLLSTFVEDGEENEDSDKEEIDSDEESVDSQTPTPETMLKLLDSKSSFANQAQEESNAKEWSLCIRWLLRQKLLLKKYFMIMLNLMSTPTIGGELPSPITTFCCRGTTAWS